MNQASRKSELVPVLPAAMRSSRAAWPVPAFLANYWDEFEYYCKNGRSMVDDQIRVAA